MLLIGQSFAGRPSDADERANYQITRLDIYKWRIRTCTLESLCSDSFLRSAPQMKLSKSMAKMAQKVLQRSRSNGRI
jgi:hypothetical protein